MSEQSFISLQPGTIIAGRYEVVKCLGSGSMGLVYACRHRELQGHMVAVKVLYPEVAQDQVASARFRNEVFASYGVSHPNVVRAYEYLRDGDLIAYTMEHIDGGDLGDRLNSTKVIPIPRIIGILSQMCSGVQAIHDAGIVHRDLKPENILLRNDGMVKIADFGIARTGHGPKLTEHGGVVGTIDYVSPEYMLESIVDWRSDIYAIGILAYEMITGESPFHADSVYATMTKRLNTDPALPSEMRTDCPKELDHITLKAMARNPEERYQSAAEIYYELQKIVNTKAEIPSASYQPPKSANNYQGPSVDISEDSVEVAVPLEVKELDLVKRSSSRGTEIITASDLDEIIGHEISESTLVSESSNATQTNLSAVIGGNILRDTEEYTPEIIDIDSQYVPEQGYKLDSLLSKPVVNTVKGDVFTNSSSIDRKRMMDLRSRNYNRKNTIMDFLTIIIAVIFGILVGFYVVKTYFPEIFGKEIITSSIISYEDIKLS